MQIKPVEFSAKCSCSGDRGAFDDNRAICENQVKHADQECTSDSRPFTEYGTIEFTGEPNTEFYVCALCEGRKE